MKSERITREDMDSIEWDDNHFKFCEFEDLPTNGKTISSDFIKCTFTDLDCYWGLVTQSNFIDCTFTNCVFRGTSFYDIRFVDCVLTDCRFLKDNLLSDCTFQDTNWYGCSIVGGEGRPTDMERGQLN